MGPTVPHGYAYVKQFVPTKRVNRTAGVQDTPATDRYRTGMVTRTRPYRVYLGEHMERHGLNDERLAAKLHVARETVTRYRNYPNRLSLPKLEEIAAAMDIEVWRLWQHPDRPSVDEMLIGQDDDTVKRVVRSLDALGIIGKTGT